jgi:hypothetical protein
MRGEGWKQDRDGRGENERAGNGGRPADRAMLLVLMFAA